MDGQVAGSPQEVARVVAACQECDMQDAWTHQPRGTSSPQGTSVASQQAGEPLTSDLSTTEEVVIAPSDSVSQADSSIRNK